MRMLLTIAVLTLAWAAGVAWGQVPVMARSDMFLLGDRGTALAHLDFVLDWQCPDSAAAWPTVLALVREVYGPSKLTVRVVAFPLPYHHQAFFAAQASRVVAAVNGSAESYFDYGALLFARQEMFSNAAMQNTPPMDAISGFFADLALECCGVPRAAFVAGMSWGANYNEVGREEWKNAAAMGAYGTPMFWVNGAQVDLPSTATVADWRQVLDPLME
jgi:protein-disulfide isomerase